MPESERKVDAKEPVRGKIISLPHCYQRNAKERSNRVSSPRRSFTRVSLKIGLDLHVDDGYLTGPAENMMEVSALPVQGSEPGGPGSSVVLNGKDSTGTPLAITPPAQAEDIGGIGDSDVAWWRRWLCCYHENCSA